jgi:hypothetical protein
MVLAMMTFGPYEFAGFGFLGMALAFTIGRAWNAVETARAKRALRRSRRLTRRARDERDTLVELLACKVIEAESGCFRRAG